MGQGSRQPRARCYSELRRARHSHKHTKLPFASPDCDRWVTGSSLPTGHYKMKAIGVVGVGLEGCGGGVVGDMGSVTK